MQAVLTGQAWPVQSGKHVYRLFTELYTIDLNSLSTHTESGSAVQGGLPIFNKALETLFLILPAGISKSCPTVTL